MYTSRLGGSSTGNRNAAEVKSTASKARSAAEALKNLAAPGTSSSAGGNSMSDLRIIDKSVCMTSE